MEKSKTENIANFFIVIPFRKWSPHECAMIEESYAGFTISIASRELVGHVDLHHQKLTIEESNLSPGLSFDKR